MTQSTDDLKAPVTKLGSITFTHKDNAAADVKFDRMAHDGNTLEMVALVAEPMRIKAIRAILHTQKGRPLIRASGVPTKYPSAGELGRTNPGDLWLDEAGYETYFHRLDYGLVHATFVTRNQDFIRFLSPDAIWLHLNSDRFSTPLLREWMPYVTRELIARRHLRECRCYRTNSGVLALSDDDKLDEIVSEGLKRGKIQVP